MIKAIKTFFKNWRLGVTFFLLYAICAIIYTTFKILYFMFSTMINYIF